MEKHIDFVEAIAPAVNQMKSGGVFLSVGGPQPNTMTIGWGSIGYYWGVGVFTAVVRASRFTFEALKSQGAFTVSVPLDNSLREELAFAGRVSGRDVNKFEGHGLTARPALRVNAPIVAECGLHFECAVRLTSPMDPSLMDAQILRRFYADGDMHASFFGEILACYRTV